MTDEQALSCPKCGSTEIAKRNHEQLLQKTGGVLLSAAGTTAGTVGGAASGATIGAAIGAVAAGPLGVIMGGTIGTLVGAVGIGITGGFLGHRLGKKAGEIVDQNIYLDYQCLKCKHRFKAPDSEQITQINHKDQ